MPDNIVTSQHIDVKTKTKKEAVKKTDVKNTTVKNNTVKDGYKLIIFETGSSYTSKSVKFTEYNRVQEIPEAEANALLKLDNFRLPNQFEVEEYFNSKED